MPIIKSSIKDQRRTARRSAVNRAAKGKVRSSLKRVRSAISENQGQAAAQAMAMSRTNPRSRLTSVARLTMLAAEAICRMCPAWVVIGASAGEGNTT